MIAAAGECNSGILELYIEPPPASPVKA